MRYEHTEEFLMGLTLKLDVVAVMASFAFLGAIVFGAF
jgi:hypothetical protein